MRYTIDPLRFFTKLRDRYGAMFSVHFPSFGRVVYLADPQLVKELFTGDPTQLHAGEANATVLEPGSGPTPCSRSTRPRTCASASCCWHRSTAGRSSTTAR